MTVPLELVTLVTTLFLGFTLMSVIGVGLTVAALRKAPKGRREQ